MINELIDKTGATKISNDIGCSLQTVNNWKNRGVPAESIIAFCKAVSWQVTPHELRPDLYPHPQDGLPEHLRQAA